MFLQMSHEMTIGVTKSKFLRDVEQYISNRGMTQIFLQAERDVPAYDFYKKMDFLGDDKLCYTRYSENENIGNFTIVQIPSGIIIEQDWSKYICTKAKVQQLNIH